MKSAFPLNKKEKDLEFSLKGTYRLCIKESCKNLLPCL